jgi:hypothetical protein
MAPSTSSSAQAFAPRPDVRSARSSRARGSDSAQRDDAAIDVVDQSVHAVSREVPRRGTRQSGLDYAVSTAAYSADMVSQLIERATARKLPSGPGKGPGRQQTPLRPAAVVCPVPGCHELIDPSRLMCRRDWHRVPRRLRDQVWYTWRSGQGASSRAHRASARLTIAVCMVRRVAGR